MLGDFARMNSKQTALADYIICLSESSARTHHAGDRPLYQSYLADAAVLLALLTRGSESGEFQTLIEQHERRCGQTFLAGPEHVAVAESWRKFRSLL